MHDEASDWLTTLPNKIKNDYRRLLEAFRTNYYKSSELRWKEVGALWNQVQGLDERVEDFVTRLRKAAKRLNFLPAVLHYEVISGLRSPIRLHEVQQCVTTLENTLRAAKKA
jgi:hypothetical protein